VFTRKVVDYLSRSPSLESATIEPLAEEMHMTERTLRRKLHEEGTNFQRIKDDYRRDKAMIELSQADKPIQKIAEELGFAEPSAFSRAFKKWTGLTPIRYKQSY
jgi:AraC-like DNA-binding protein